MPQHDDRFAAGVEMLRTWFGDSAAEEAIANHRAPPDVLAELSDWAIENNLGFVLQRSGLPRRDKAVALLCVDIATARSAASLRDHVRFALKCGVAPDELFEICFLLALYCGLPTIREASALITAVLKENEDASLRPDAGRADRGLLSEEGSQ